MPKTRPLTAVILACVATLLTACAATPSSAPVRTSASTQDKQKQQLNFKLASGTYRCELGQKIDVQRAPHNANQIALNWQGSRHTLLRYDSNSGLPRFEDRENGLLWIDLPWKSVLMDSNSGRPLVNDCKSTG